MMRVVLLVLSALTLVGCKGCNEQKSTDAMQRKHPSKAPEESDCAKKGGKCVAREDQRECKEGFYSHACADLGSDQPICCVFAQ